MHTLTKKRFILFFIIISNLSFAQVLTPIVDSIPMSDGRKLAADIYIPSGMTSGPVILIQTPYNRILYRFGLPLRIGTNLNSSNYIFVIADWRGFYGSAGAMYTSPTPPTRGVDGASAVEWIYTQPWCNGKIGTWGPSALGKVQFQTAKENPPHLTCICPLVAGSQFDYDEYYPNGCLRTEYVQQLDGLGFGLSPFIVSQPVHNITWTFVENQNYYPASIQVPCFMIGGWYDHNIEVMLELFNGIRTSSPIAVRNQHRLLMGPWVHGGHGAAYVGSATQGQLSYPNAQYWSDSLALMYFDYHLRTISNGWNSTQYVQYYQLGENTWNTSPAWPPTGTTPVNFYFHQSGALNENMPANGTDFLSFNYNPANPSPTIGGTTLRADLDQGPYDQAPLVESRNDILTFTTNTFTQNTVLKGKATIHMKVASDKLDTDFCVRLTDVYPDGRSMLVNDGVMRMRFRNGTNATDTASMIPNTIYDCVINLPNTSITFLAGHKLRVDITSSNYPRFNRNMNTGGAMYPGGKMDTLVNPQTASNKVYTNNVNQSYITLPLIGFTSNISILENNLQFDLYPNPANSFLNINTGLTENYSVTIYTILGQVVFTEQSNDAKKINIQPLPPGVYSLEIKCKDTVAQKKFVKE
jgi:predicted acyl esterase